MDAEQKDRELANANELHARGTSRAMYECDCADPYIPAEMPEENASCVDPEAGCVAKGAEAVPLNEDDKEAKSFCCPRVLPSETVTACCPRLGRYACVMCMIRGRSFLIQGPDWMVTWLCLWPTILIPTGCFLIFAVPWIAERSAALAFASFAVIGGFWLTLFCASCTDPGILMKYNEPVPKPESEIDEKNPRRRQLRMCTKCKLYQPPQTSHCNECGVCVYGYDHHCGFMGQCVGAKSLWAFQAFLGCICFVVVFMMASVVISKSLA